MARINNRTFQIGDVVQVAAEAIDQETDLIGRVKYVNSHHITIEDRNHIRHSIHSTDFRFVKLLESSDFLAYSQEDYFKDIVKSLK